MKEVLFITSFIFSSSISAGPGGGGTNPTLLLNFKNTLDNFYENSLNESVINNNELVNYYENHSKNKLEYSIKTRIKKKLSKNGSSF